MTALLLNQKANLLLVKHLLQWKQLINLKFVVNTKMFLHLILSCKK